MEYLEVLAQLLAASSDICERIKRSIIDSAAFSFCESYRNEACKELDLLLYQFRDEVTELLTYLRRNNDSEYRRVGSAWEQEPFVSYGNEAMKHVVSEYNLYCQARRNAEADFFGLFLNEYIGKLLKFLEKYDIEYW